MAKVMLVTGGSRGIGAATARLAARDGYDVTVNYARDADAAARVVDDIEKAGCRAVAIQGDMGKPEDVARLFAEHDKAFGRLDAFIANAGIVNPVGRVDGTDVARLQRIIAINVTGVFLGCAEAVRRMSTRHGGAGGSIVTLSSAASRLGGPGMYIDYATTKGAVDTLTLSLAKEVAGEGIRVNGVRPGMIATEIHNTIRTPEEYARTVTTVPAGRAGSAEEVAETILWLCSDAASYVTMTLMDVSGGR